MKINVHNIRLGFATNSSSSHSIIVIPEGIKMDDVVYDYECFGWEQFILASEEAKRVYLIGQLAISLNGVFDSYKTNKLLDEWFGVTYNIIEDIEYSYLQSPTIDHQSIISFPGNTTKELATSFVDGLSKNDRVVILGGNDNDGEMSGPFGSKHISVFDYFRDFYGDVRFRQDGEYSIFYAPSTGNKIRFSFNRITEEDSAKDYIKASTPELVDVKITDYCPYGCSWCYQSSTKKGQHAKLEDIEKLFKTLSEMEVFEVAIGGGEPTMHPQFLDILKCAVKYNLTPNFTTFSTAWLKDKELVDYISEHVGGIGVSVHNIKDFSKVRKIKEVIATHCNDLSITNRYDTIIAQHVVGSVGVDDTAHVINEAKNNHYHLLLLGYKDTGFGFEFNSFNDYDLSLILKMILDNPNRRMTLSVDTAILQQFPNLPKMLKVDPILYTTKEGKFSCYVDVVNKLYGPSSYCKKEEFVDLPSTVKEMTNIFAKW